MTGKGHLCFIADPGSIHIKRWIACFVSKGYRVSVISYNPVRRGTDPGPDVAVYDLTRWCNIKGLRFLAWGLVVRHLLQKLKPDIVHAHNIAGAGWVGLFSGFRPFIATAHGSDMMLMAERSRTYRRLNAMVLGSADYVTAGSMALFTQCLRYGGKKRATEHLMIGTDTSVFNPGISRERARRILGLRAGPMVFFIRSMHDIYNPLMMVRAMPEVAKAIPGVRFLFPLGNGDPGLIASHQKMIGDLGLGQQVNYIDPVGSDREMALWYRASDIAVSIPDSDGVSIAVVEAMACGLPVVITDLPAYQGIFRNRENVVKIPLNRSDALARAVIPLLKDKGKGRLLGRRASRTVFRYADQTVSMKRMDKIYNRLISAQGRV